VGRPGGSRGGVAATEDVLLVASGDRLGVGGDRGGGEVRSLTDSCRCCPTPERRPDRAGSPGGHRPVCDQPALRALLDGFARNDLLLFASAISFQVLTALVPLALFALAALGFLGLSEVWAQEVRPQVVEGLSPAATRVIDDTVGKVLGSAQLFWVTAGAAIAIWQLSGAVRAAMEALNRVYRAREERSFGRRYAVSLTLAVAFAALTFSASSVVVFVPLLDGDPPVLVGGLLFLGRWGVAAVLLGLAVGLLVHQGPDREQPLGWVSAGAVSIVGSWVATSVAFGLYLSTVAVLRLHLRGAGHGRRAHGLPLRLGGRLPRGHPGGRTAARPWERCVVRCVVPGRRRSAATPRARVQLIRRC